VNHSVATASGIAAAAAARAQRGASSDDEKCSAKTVASPASRPVAFQ
jgi:hypothetical protein